MARREIVITRVYDDPGRRDDEYRVLVDRLWPRGLTKRQVDYDEWAKDLAPSGELRTWYGHDPERFAQFSRRYRSELKKEPGDEALARVLSAAGRRSLVLLTATRDVEHSGAQVLQRVLSASRRQR